MMTPISSYRSSGARIGKAAAVAVLAILFASPVPAEKGMIEGGGTFYASNSTDSLILEYEDPKRSEWQQPERVVEQLQLQPGEAVADIGAGSGYFSVLFAKKVGPRGKVYAVDVDAGMLQYVERRAKKESLANVVPVLAKTDDPVLPNDSADLIFMCNTYMFLDQREKYLARLRDILKPDGRLAVISFNKSETPEGPPVHTRVSREKTLLEAGKAGFAVERELVFLPYQHFLIFKKR